MNLKTGQKAIAALLAMVVLAAVGTPAHALQITERTTNASYVPGDSGTLAVTVVNDDTGASLELRNLTIYFPWAQPVDGKWPSGANVTVNLSPWVTLGSQGSGNNVYTYSTSFNIPTWFAGSLFGGPSGTCPRDPTVRYGQYSSCVLLGITSSPPRYQGDSFGIAMALPIYSPPSLVAQWLPIATLVVLVVATAFLALAWTSLRRMTKKAA